VRLAAAEEKHHRWNPTADPPLAGLALVEVYPLPSRSRGGLVRHLALGERQGRRARAGSSVMGRSGLAGCRFPANVIAVALRGYPRHGLSYRDVEEPLAERGVVVDHDTVYR
jgi:hypothetical protein